MNRKILSLALLCLAGTISFAEIGDSEKSLITSGKTKSPPQIDGILNDDCWKNTIEITPFILRNEDRFASEQSSVFICHDEKNLYAAFLFKESCLIPESNRAHEFKADTSKKDDPQIWNDDSAVLLIMPDMKNKNEVFDFFINGNGIINDAMCKAPDYWGSRDVSWDSGAAVAAKKDNGFWTVEISIPLEKIKLTPGKTEAAGIVLARIEKSRAEVSSWQPLVKGFHISESFGKIVPADKVPGIKISSLPEFQPGKNILKLNWKPISQNDSLRIYEQVRFDKSKPLISWKDATAAMENFASDFDLNKTGSFKYRWTYSNPSSMKTYFESPEYKLNVACSKIESNLKPANTQTFINGAPFKSSASLIKGKNVIAIKSEGNLSGNFSAEGFVCNLDGTWKFSGEEVPGWQSADFDDSAWKNAAAENGILVKKGFFRKIILFQDSMTWPNWEKEGIFINRGGLQQLICMPKGIKGKKLSDYKFIIEVPENFDIPAVTSYYNKYKITLTAPGSTIHDAVKYKKYSAAFENTMNYHEAPALHEYFIFGIRAPEKETVSNGDIYFYSEGANGNIVEIPQKIKLHLLPALNGKQAKKLTMQMWTGWLRTIPDKTLLSAFGSELVKMGVNEVGGIPHEKLRQLMLINFKSWNIDCSGYLKEHPEHSLVNAEIKPNVNAISSAYICPEAMLNEKSAQEFLNSAIGKFMKKNNYPHNVNWDYEHDVFKSYISCFCPRCIEKFKKQFSINADLTASLIKEKYSPQWVKFMDQEMAELAGLFRKIVKKTSPESVFSVYSGYQSEYTKSHYGVDWKMLADKIDIAECGYGRSEKDLGETLDALGSTPLIVGEIVHPYDVKSREYPTYLKKATLMRRLCDGTGGVLFYDLASMDGKSFYSIAEVSRFAADNEDFLLGRKKADANVKVTGLSKEAYQMFEHKGRQMLLVMNETSSEKSFKAELTNIKGNVNINEYYSGKTYKTAVIEEKLPAGDAKVFIIEP